MAFTSFEQQTTIGRLGKAPARSDIRALMLHNFLDTAKEPPIKTNFWKTKAAFPLRTFGNDNYGDCTRASQALLSMRMERIEQRKTPEITDEEIVRVYLAMTEKYYGGGDTGGFEMDALNEWRRPETTFRDTKGRPLTIDAYVRINQADIKAVKNAIATAGAHGIKVCFNLPIAWAYAASDWDIPEGIKPTGDFLPGSWGGHSMTAIDYDERGVYLPSSWGLPIGRISWRAFMIYCDEAYLVIDSINAWKKKKTNLDVMGIKKAVNLVSSFQIK